ncbi:MAG: phosphate acyltransferase PlsX [Fidelibacterota bacterium]
MIIAVDAMGGDFAPASVVQGVIQAIATTTDTFQILLLGDKEAIRQQLGDFQSSRLEILPTTEIVTMDDRASKVIKTKPDSSLVKGIRLVQDQEADAFVSAGNTGAVMTTSLLTYGRIKNVKRPALSAYIPTLSGGKILCDVGANPDVKPYHLLQFAIMASYYFEHIEGYSNPKIGLINIGAEETKGSELYRETHQLFKSQLPGFIGNIEGRNIMDSEAHILICDGFVGNTLLKFAEGWIKIFSDEIKSKLRENYRYQIGAYLLKPVFKSLNKKFDYEEHGGTPLLGVNGLSIITHGSAGPKAIANSILVAQKCINENLVGHIQQNVESYLGVMN